MTQTYSMPKQSKENVHTYYNTELHDKHHCIKYTYNLHTRICTRIYSAAVDYMYICMYVSTYIQYACTYVHSGFLEFGLHKYVTVILVTAFRDNHVCQFSSF